MIYNNDCNPVQSGLEEGVVMVESFMRIEGGLRLNTTCPEYTQQLVIPDEFVPILFNLLGIKEDNELNCTKLNVCLAEFPRGIVGVRHHAELNKWMLWPN